MTLYEKLGGEAAINAVVNKFYQFMLEDIRVAHFFTTTDMKKQIQRQTQFITLVTGGPNKYEGNDMKTAHCKLKICKEDFDVTWENLFQALKCFNVPEAEINQLKEIFYSVESQIVNTSKETQKCPFSNKQKISLFDRLGGPLSINAVVNKFYEFMLKDKRVAHFFATTDMNKQIERQTQFITLVTGGPNNYQGGDMKTAHCKLKIGKEDFDATWENLFQALKYFNVSEIQVNQLKQIFYSVEGQIVNTKKDSINQLKHEQKVSHYKHQQQYDMNKIDQCPHMQIKLSNFESSIKHQKLTQAQKRKIKQQFIKKQIQNNKPQQKLSNCPYQKHFY